MARCNTGVKPIVTANGIPDFMKHHQMKRPRMPIGPPTSTKLIVSISPCSGINQSGPTIWSPRQESQPPQCVIIDKSDIYKGNLMLEPNASYRFNQLEKIDEVTEQDSADSDSFKLKSCNSETHINRLDGGCMNWGKKHNVKDGEVKDDNTKCCAKGEKNVCGSPLKDVSENAVQKLDQIEYLEKEIQRFSKDLNDIRTEIVPLSDRKKIKSISTYATDVNEVLLKLKQRCISLQGSIDKVINDDPITCHHRINEETAHSPDCGTKISLCEKELPQSNDGETCCATNISTEQCCDTLAASQRQEKPCTKQEVSQIDACNQSLPPLPPSPSCSDASDACKAEQVQSNNPKSSCHTDNQSRVQQNSPIITYGLTEQSIPKMIHRTYQLKPRKSIHTTATSCTCHSGSEKSKKKECEILKLPVNFRPSEQTLAPGHLNSHTNPWDQSTNHKCRQSVESDPCPPDTSSCSTPSPRNSKKCSKSCIITHNLFQTICDLVGNNDPNYIALTVILKSNNLYHINISVTNTGQSLGDICATEAAVKQAKCQRLFKKFLTFFILNSKFTPKQKTTILGHSFQLIDTESGRKSSFESRSHQTKNNNVRRDLSNRQQNEDFKTEKTSNVHGLTDQTRNSTPTHFTRIPGGNSKENLEKPKEKQSPNRGPFVYTGHYYDMANYLKRRNGGSGESSTRITHLEEQVLKLREELTNIREELVPQDDIIKFSNLSERLQELNDLLQDLRKSYENINSAEKKNAEDFSAENNKRHSMDRSLRLSEFSNEMDDGKSPQDQNTSQYVKRHSLDRSLRLSEFSNAMDDNKSAQDQNTSQYVKRHSLDRSLRLSEFSNAMDDNKSAQDQNTSQYVKRPSLDLSSRLDEFNIQMDNFKFPQDQKTSQNVKRHSSDRSSRLGEFNNEMDNSKSAQDKKTSQPCESYDNPVDNYAPPDTAECKKFFDNIKNPTNVFERHLLMMKDFRTDAELRRQRLERKRREKAELQEMRNVDENHEKQRASSFMAKDDNDWKLFKGNASAMRESKDMESHARCSQSTAHCSPNNFQIPNGNTYKRRSSSQSTQTEDLAINRSPLLVDATTLDSAESIKIMSPNCSVPSISEKIIINSNLGKALKDILDKLNMDPYLIVLTITLESNNLYHINIWATSSGRALCDVYASEAALQEAEAQAIFGKFLTYIVVSDKNTSEQKHRLLQHSFKIMKEHQ